MLVLMTGAKWHLLEIPLNGSDTGAGRGQTPAVTVPPQESSTGVARHLRERRHDRAIDATRARNWSPAPDCTSQSPTSAS